MEKEWKCGKCGKWVSTAYYVHNHVEMTPRPIAGSYSEDGLAGANVVTYNRTYADPVRECSTVNNSN